MAKNTLLLKYCSGIFNLQFAATLKTTLLINLSTPLLLDTIIHKEFLEVLSLIFEREFMSDHHCMTANKVLS
jgi:hypothetical protein